MEGFSISCTTCRARLRVRDDRIVGQIVPCPKCGSLVLVNRPQARPGSGSRSLSDLGLARGSSAGAPVPRCDSFDNIDRLLDEPVRLPAAEPAAASSPRWRVNESLPGEPDASETPAADGSHPAAASDDEVPNAPPEDEVAADWLAARSAMLRPYLLLGGGAVLGASLAFGFAAWFLIPSESAPPPGPMAAAVAADVAEATEPRAVPDADGPSDAEPAIELEDESDQEALSVEEASNETDAAAEPAELDEPAEPDPSAEPAGPSLPDGPSGGSPFEESAVASTPSPAVSPTAEATSAPAARTTPASRSGNDLAAFAQWLQDADAITAPAASPIVQAPAEEVPEQLASPTSQLPVVPSRPAPPPVNVAARLKQPIEALKLEKVPLIDALRLVTQISTIPVRLDPDALGRHNLRADHLISVRVSDVTVSGLLDAVVEKSKLAWYADEDHVIVTTAAEAKGELVPVRHPVGDLTNENRALAESLAADIQRLIAHGSWAGQGGEEDGALVGRIEVDGSSLQVTHRDVVQYQILVFCEKLRIVRGLAPRSKVFSDRLAPGSRVDACTGLETSVSLRIGQPRGIDQIAGELSAQTQLQILVDWPALYAAGWSPSDTEPFFCQQQPLRAVLDEWLSPKGLAWRVFDAQTLEITTPLMLDAVNDVEFYRLELAPGEAPAEVASRISRTLLSKLGEAAFQPHGSGDIKFDPLSKTLIVSLPQPQQAIARELCRGGR